MSHCVYGHWVVIVCLIAWRFDYNRKNENEIHFERNVNSAIRTHMKASLSLESCVCRAHSSDYLLRMDFELKVGRMYLTCAFFIHVCGIFFCVHSFALLILLSARGLLSIFVVLAVVLLRYSMRHLTHTFAHSSKAKCVCE